MSFADRRLQQQALPLSTLRSPGSTNKNQPIEPLYEGSIHNSRPRAKSCRKHRGSRGEREPGLCRREQHSSRSWDRCFRPKKRKRTLPHTDKKPLPTAEPKRSTADAERGIKPEDERRKRTHPLPIYESCILRSPGEPSNMVHSKHKGMAGPRSYG